MKQETKTMMTNDTQNTPGPWHRNIRADGKYPIIFAGRNQHVAQATQQKDSKETEANIDLIAAAPELLEALELIVDHYRPSGWHEGDFSLAKQAIAKARGKL